MSYSNISRRLPCCHPTSHEHPMCFDNATIINIARTVPTEWAVPLYGYLMPALVMFTTTTNLFIVIVLSQRHLRTPTNFVLLAMALTDLMTGWTSIPWFIFYYTLEGYKLDQEWGLSTFWCHAYGYLYEVLPSVCHTATIWLTVFLAVQRYVYVCVPNSVHLYCTPRTTKICIISIVLFAASTVLPELLGRRRHQYVIGARSECVQCHSSWVTLVLGKNAFYSANCWSKTALHFAPCILLLVFTRKLARTIKAAEIRKRSWATESMFERRGSISPRCSAASSGRSMYATNRMLAVICTVFFILEVPAGLIYGLQLLILHARITDESTSDHIYDLINRLLIIRHLLIVLTSPIQFAIYCSMSEQFRLTARQLFTSRLLFVAQAQATFHGGKRYSLILVDVETFAAKRNASSFRRSLVARGKNSLFEKTYGLTSRPGSVRLPTSKRKVCRQVSFPDEDTRERERVGPLTRSHQSLRATLRRSSAVSRFARMTSRGDGQATSSSETRAEDSAPASDSGGDEVAACVQEVAAAVTFSPIVAQPGDEYF